MNPALLLLNAPPEQRETVRLLDVQFKAFKQNERKRDAALKRSEAQRQSILKKAFSGRLVSQAATDGPASDVLARLRVGRDSSAPATKRKAARQP
jgi:type I restriction enzyme, S subunit